MERRRDRNQTTRRGLAFAALVVSGSMLLFSTMGGWHNLLGVTMISLGVFGMVVLRIGMWLRERGRR